MGSGFTLSAAFTSVIGGVVAAAIVAVFNYYLTLRRERQSLLFDRRLIAYADTLEVIVDNDEVLISRGGSVQSPSSELIKRRNSISHRLQLIGAKNIHDLYHEYTTQMIQATQLPDPMRPPNPPPVTEIRDRLVKAMRSDLESLGM
jgi:hypothetical protein